jgi:hypothetical protein
MSRCYGFVVDSVQQIHNKLKQWSVAFDLSTTNLKAVQQIEKMYNKSPANPQQIEQVEFELRRQVYLIGK